MVIEELENRIAFDEVGAVQEPTTDYGYSFQDLECWKAGQLLRKDIRVLAQSFPQEEKYLLCQQIIRSSRSVTANIAEGYGRFHYKENIQFCRIARGSLFETLDHLSVALDEGYIGESQFHEWKSRISEVAKVLNGYINYLVKQLGTKK